MAAKTGRTVSRWTQFLVDDSAGTLRAIPVNSINGVGLSYPVIELAAFQDAIRGVLPNTPECTITITGPWDTLVAATAPALSGSHTILSAIVGGVTPLSLDCKFGIRQVWDAEPQFGITSTATDGFLCTAYIPDIGAGTYSATFQMAAGSAAPAWGVAAET